MSLSLIEEYNLNLAPHLTRLKEDLEKDLRQLIEAEGLLIHSLNGRVKTKKSLEGKLARPDRSYQEIFDVTDLVGFRIVTQSEDLISKAARLIEDQFDVDFNHSVNKLLHEDSQKFGYRSLHYVCRLPAKLQGEFPGIKTSFKFEIQIRTILQHVWAEIEHDIGYKTTEQLPKELRRRFSQVASLLEVADREFAAIRTDLKSYEDKLREKDIQRELVELNQISLGLALRHEEVLKIDEEISRFLNIQLSESVFYPDYLLRVLQAAGLKRLNEVLQVANDLRDSLTRFLPIYFNFAKAHWGLNQQSVREVQKGYGLLFIAHLWILQEESLFIDKVNRLTKFYYEIDYPNDLDSAKSAAQSLVSFMKSSEFIR